MAITLRDKIIELATAEIGTKGGKATGDDKYIQWYNETCGTKFSVSTTPWCAIWVTYILRHAGVSTTACPNFASCTSLRDNFAKKKGVWHPRGDGYQPKKGDPILFDWDQSGNCDHVGIYNYTSNGKHYTIEGNTSSSVAARSYETNSVKIAGFVELKLPDDDKYVNTTPEPAPSTSTPSASNDVYVVKKGDSLSKIAKLFNTTVAVLVSLNGISNPNLIKVGQKIKLPVSNTGTVTSSGKTYTVKKGDSLWEIAKAQLGSGNRWTEIQKLNGITGTKIVVGQVLKIPV